MASRDSLRKPKRMSPKKTVPPVPPEPKKSKVGLSECVRKRLRLAKQHEYHKYHVYLGAKQLPRWRHLQEQLGLGAGRKGDAALAEILINTYEASRHLTSGQETPEASEGVQTTAAGVLAASISSNEVERASKREENMDSDSLCETPDSHEFAAHIKTEQTEPDEMQTVHIEAELPQSGGMNTEPLQLDESELQMKIEPLGPDETSHSEEGSASLDFHSNTQIHVFEGVGGKQGHAVGHDPPGGSKQTQDLTHQLNDITCVNCRIPGMLQTSSNELRLDRHDHWPAAGEGCDHACVVCRARHYHFNKYNPGTSYADNPHKRRKTTMKCKKCNVYLCCNVQKDCFEVYHTVANYQDFILQLVCTACMNQGKCTACVNHGVPDGPGTSNGQLRLDSLDHWPGVGEGYDHVCVVCNARHLHFKKHNPGASYADNPHKRRKTSMKCKKCGVYLCCNGLKDCFEVYHTVANYQDFIRQLVCTACMNHGTCSACVNRGVPSTPRTVNNKLRLDCRDHWPGAGEGYDHVCVVCNARHLYFKEHNPGTSYADNPHKRRKTSMKCKKCGVYLCCNPQKDCFEVYHTIVNYTQQLTIKNYM